MKTELETVEGLRELLAAPRGKQRAAVEAAVQVLRGGGNGPLLLTASPAARRLGISRACLYGWLRRGLLKPVGGLTGARLRFSAAELDRLAAGGAAGVR